MTGIRQEEKISLDDMGARVYIGTSGWVYKDWGKKFFPKGLPREKHLRYLSERFNTVEINGSFYRLQPPSNYERWRKSTRAGFVFAVKVSRFITHIKRMHAVRAPWTRFFRTTLPLKLKCGPFLFQFPPSFSGRPEEVRRIDNFLGRLRRDSAKLRVAFEFRHANCFSEGMLQTLSRHRAALVFANSSKYPAAPFVTPADFVYIRLHGPKKLFSSSYSDVDLRKWAALVRRYRKERKDVYVYFNNDQNADAPANARTLQRMVGR